MSCGNRFQCSLTKTSRHSFQPDKPSNPELHNENKKRLNELLKARENQDKIYSLSTATPTQISTDIIDPELSITLTSSNDSTYTPWKTPSTEYYSLNRK